MLSPCCGEACEKEASIGPCTMPPSPLHVKLRVHLGKRGCLRSQEALED